MSVSVDFAEATRQIFARFLAQWVDGSNNPLTIVNLDDESMPQPSGVSWVRIATREQLANLKALDPAGNRYEGRGVTWIQVFAPGGDAGVQTANSLAVTARKIFRGKRLSPALVFDGSARLITMGFDGATFYQVNVYAPFRYYETTT